VARSDAQQRGLGRPLLPELELTEPKTVTFTPEQRAEFVSLMICMIISHLREQRLQQARAVVATNDSYQPTEDPGHCPAP
jgi:hypothetical protein